MTSSSPDRLVRILEAGLCTVILLAPLPFGAVLPSGRTGLEIVCAVLLVLWCARAWRRSDPAPPRALTFPLAAVLGLILFQAVPLGEPAVGLLSPRVLEIHEESTPGGGALAAERDLLGIDPEALTPSATLSLAPQATASGLRTAAALAALVLIAWTVARERGTGRLAWALALSAAFQAVHGSLVLLTGHDQIWHVPKRYFLDCATGTFVNRSHFAIYLACTLPPALAAARAGGTRFRGVGRRLAYWLGPEGGRILLLRSLVLLGAAGLFLSFSRAGIALGMAALGWTWFSTTRLRGKARIFVAGGLLVLAALPLLRFDPDRLAMRFSRVPEHLSEEGGRLTVWRDGIGILADFPAVGTGLGTFSQIYPSYRSPRIRKFYDHAHNDILQWTLETGIAGLALLLPFLLLAGRRAASALAGRFGGTCVGFGAGLTAIALHSLVDFPFHIPAIAAVAAILAGALLGAPCRQEVG